MIWQMSDVTRLLQAIDRGEPQATAELLSLVYGELRELARYHMASERDEHTLQPTALVHEAYLRLLGGGESKWDGRRHFFAAAAEAMRRILIEHARKKNAAKRGGRLRRVEFNLEAPPIETAHDDLDNLLALDEALSRLAIESPAKAQLVKLRYFAGLSIDEAAQAMNISPTTAKRHWAVARAWLYNALESSR
jgi:RNA polymerase sigma factor (TIGR02999 family)